jgi:hypothetical protein
MLHLMKYLMPKKIRLLLLDAVVYYHFGLHLASAGNFNNFATGTATAMTPGDN